MMLKFGVKLVTLNCVESFTYLYPEKGHTHWPLEEFEDDMDVVDILDHFMKTSRLDAGTREGAKAYTLDEAAEFVKWADEVDLAMSALTRPEALSISVVVSSWVP